MEWQKTFHGMRQNLNMKDFIITYLVNNLTYYVDNKYGYLWMSVLILLYRKLIQSGGYDGRTK